MKRAIMNNKYSIIHVQKNDDQWCISIAIDINDKHVYVGITQNSGVINYDFITICGDVLGDKTLDFCKNFVKENEAEIIEAAKEKYYGPSVCANRVSHYEMMQIAFNWRCNE